MFLDRFCFFGEYVWIDFKEIIEESLIWWFNCVFGNSKLVGQLGCKSSPNRFQTKREWLRSETTRPQEKVNVETPSPGNLMEMYKNQKTTII